MKMSLIVTALTAAGLLVSPASAAMIGTFVDATAANTTALDGSVAISSDSADQYNGLWWERNGWGQDDTSILEGRRVDPIDLKTVITGLIADQEYDIYVLYSGWSLSASPKAGLTAGSLAPASDSTVLNITGDDGYSDFGIIEALIGRTTADGAGEIVVYLDGASATARTWYDGVSYAAVPEPATLGLLALGAMALLGRRR